MDHCLTTLAIACAAGLAAAPAWACPQGPFDPNYDMTGALELMNELYGTPNPLYRIASGSMAPEYGIGDIIIINKIMSFYDIAQGDVVVFWDPFEPKRVIVHRALYYDGEHWIMKGDANPAPLRKDVVGPDNYIGVVQGHYKKIFDIQEQFPWYGVFAGSMSMLRDVGLDDCQHYIDERVPVPVLKLQHAIFIVDPDVHFVVSHFLIWFGLLYPY